MRDSTTKDEIDWGPQVDIIDGPERVRSILERLRNGTENLTVHVGEHSLEFRSLVVEVLPAERPPALYIDTLIPKNGMHLLQEGYTLRMDFHLDDVSHYFVSDYLGTERRGLPAIKLSYPNVLYRYQKRRTFRVEPSLDEPVSVTIEEPSFTLNAEDISATGLRFRLPTKDHGLEEGDKLNNLSIRLPTKPRPTTITCDAVVRNLISRFPEGRARTFVYCGAEFNNIDSKDRETIFYYCFQRQREELKKGSML